MKKKMIEQEGETEIATLTAGDFQHSSLSNPEGTWTKTDKNLQ